MRRWRAIRIIIGVCAPAPIGTIIVSIAHVNLGLPISALPVFFLLTTLLGYASIIVPCIVYALLVELAGTYLPILRRNIIIYTCFNAVALGACVALPLRILGGGDPRGMFLPLGAFAGATTALILYPLTPKATGDRQALPNAADPQAR